MANGRPGRKCVDRGIRKDGDPYCTTPKQRKWQQEFAKKNPEKRLQYERNYRLNLSEEERAVQKEAKRVYMQKWMQAKRLREIMAEIEQRRNKTGG